MRLIGRWTLLPAVILGVCVKGYLTTLSGDWVSYPDALVLGGCIGIGTGAVMWLVEGIAYLHFRHQRYKYGCGHSASYRDYVKQR